MPRSRWCVVLTALASSVASAQPPPPMSLALKNAPLHEIAQRVGAASRCTVMGMARGTFDFSINKQYLWDAFAMLEGEDNIHARSSGASFILSAAATPGQPDWLNGWQRHGPWAVAYVPGVGGMFRVQPAAGAAPSYAGRLLLLGLEDYVVDRVVFGPTPGGKPPLAITTTPPAGSAQACTQTTVALSFANPPSDHGSFTGNVVVKVTGTIDRRVQVPAGDDVVDVSEGRLRIHIASRPRSPTEREIHVGWDTMGDAGSVGVELVDEHGAAVKTSGSGSGRGGSQGNEERTVTWTGVPLFVVLHIPAGPVTEATIPFRFDNVALTAP